MRRTARASDPALELVAFDADDTLWHNERSYRAARDQFSRMLSGAGVALSPDATDAHVNGTEVGATSR